MPRIPQPKGTRGSLRWIQHFVNEAPDALNATIGIGPIEWRSPLAIDDYAEYRDSSFLDLLGIKLPRRSLASFWPSGGPQWDALGRAESGEVVLVEAKAHVGEILTPASRGSEDSLKRIRASLAETATALGALPGSVDWSQRFYQYTNRLAHAYLLNRLNGVRAVLAFLYFIGDSDMNGPQSRREWEAALAVVHEALGLRGRVPPYAKNVFIDVPEVSSASQLGTRSVERAPVPKKWRNDPRKAAEIMKEILPNRADRDFLLTQLSESIQKANSVAPNAWAVTLYENGFRLNVGRVEVLTAFDGQVGFFIHGDYPAVPEAVRNYIQLVDRKSVPGLNYFFCGNVKRFRLCRDVLLPAHYDLIAKAGRTKTGRPVAGTPHRVAHSRGLVDLAQSIAQRHL